MKTTEVLISRIENDRAYFKLDESFYSFDLVGSAIYGSEEPQVGDRLFVTKTDKKVEVRDYPNTEYWEEAEESKLHLVR